MTHTPKECGCGDMHCQTKCRFHHTAPKLLEALEIATFIISRNSGLKLPHGEAMAFLPEARAAIREAREEN